MTITIDPDREGLPVPWTLLVCGGLLAAASALIISAEVLLRVTPGSLIPALGSTVAIVVATVAAARRAGVRPVWAEGERLLLLVVAVIGTVLARRVFDWPFFAPRGFSVDGAHHDAIVEYIAQHLRFATGTGTSLERFAQYPNGGHVLAAVGSLLPGVAPIQAMGFLAFICLLMIVAIGGVTASYVTAQAGRRTAFFPFQHNYAPTVAALAVPVLAFAASRFTIGMISQDYFFAQLVALTVVCAGIGSLVVFASGDAGPDDAAGVSVLLLPVIGLFSAASTFIYPLQIGLLPFAVGLVWLVRRERTWLIASLVSGLSVVAVLAFTIPLLGASRSMAGDEGVIAEPRLAELGGLATALLVCEGLLVLASRDPVRRRGYFRPASVALAGPFLLACAQTVGLLMLRHIPGLPTISRYTAYKNVYLAVPFGLVIAAVGAGHAWSCIPVLRTRLASSALTGLLVLHPVLSAVGRTDLTNASRPLVSSDAYHLLRGSRTLVGNAPIAILAPDIEPYALAWTALQRPVAALPNPYLVDSLTIADLPKTGRRFILVVGRARANRLLVDPTLAVVGQRGDAVLFGPAGGAGEATVKP